MIQNIKDRERVIDAVASARKRANDFSPDDYRAEYAHLSGGLLSILADLVGLPYSDFTSLTAPKEKGDGK